MKRAFHIIPLIVCCLAFFASCDKIESDNYNIFSGAVGQWYDGNGVADHSQRAFIEKYTGVRCLNCPTADVAITAALQQFDGKLIAVSIHDSISSLSRPYPDNVDLRNGKGTQWSTFFGIRTAGLPSGLVNRRKNSSDAWDIFNPASGIDDRVNAIISNTPSLALAVEAVKEDNSIAITTNIEFLQSVGDKLAITILIMEDGIVATQLQPDGVTKDDNYVHNHVLRDVITDVWGSDVDCSGTAGEKRFARFNYAAFSQEWNLDRCHIVAFVSNKESREILNVAECEIQ